MIIARRALLGTFFCVCVCHTMMARAVVAQHYYFHNLRCALSLYFVQIQIYTIYYIVQTDFIFQKIDIHILNCFGVVTYFQRTCNIPGIAGKPCFRRMEASFQIFFWFSSLHRSTSFFRQNLVRILEVDTLVIFFFLHRI